MPTAYLGYCRFFAKSLFLGLPLLEDPAVVLLLVLGRYEILDVGGTARLRLRLDLVLVAHVHLPFASLTRQRAPRADLYGIGRLEVFQQIPQTLPHRRRLARTLDAAQEFARYAVRAPSE